METYALIGMIAVLWPCANSQFFREELFPEQIQQQELQLETQKFQDQLQNLTVFWQNNPESMPEVEFLKVQKELLEKLQETQSKQQELQNLLQLRLTKHPFSFSQPDKVKLKPKLPVTPVATTTTTAATTSTTVTTTTAANPSSSTQRYSTLQK